MGPNGHSAIQLFHPMQNMGCTVHLARSKGPHDTLLVLLDVDPRLNPLRSDPRFATLANRHLESAGSQATSRAALPSKFQVWIEVRFFEVFHSQE